MLLAALGLAVAGHAQERRWVVAFANVTEEPGVTLEGTGFTGRDVRASFELAARRFPVDLVYYDNQRDRARTLANAEAAVARRVDLFIEYSRDAAATAEIADRLRAARIPILAVNGPVPGAPLYTVDNLAAGRIAGDALGQFALRSWRGRSTLGVLIGDLGAQALGVPERAQGAREALTRHLPSSRVVTLDTHGNPAQVAPLLGKLLAAQPATKLLIATMDDATALAAKGALESAGRLLDAAIVSQGADPSIHGGINDRREIDPANRGSIVIGSVAFLLDRYGYEVLPLAVRMLRGEAVPARTATRHVLITAANVFREYPPYDMN